VKDFVRAELEQTPSTLKAVCDEHAISVTLVKAAECTALALRAGRKLLIAGNGGSAADAQHLAAEFVSRLTFDRPALIALALTTDTSILTAVGNDYSYEKVFQRQLEAVGQKGDIFLGISTSGKSPNILRALETARAQGRVTIGLARCGGGMMKDLCDHLIIVPSRITQHIQEAHLALEHIFCGLVERRCFDIEVGERRGIANDVTEPSQKPLRAQ